MKVVPLHLLDELADVALVLASRSEIGQDVFRC